MEKVEKFLMKNKFTSFFLNADNYACIYITICILWFFPLLGQIINPLSKVCFVWGAGLVAWEFFTKRRMFKSIYWALPLCIIAAYVISILLNIRYNLYMGVKHFVYLCISLLVLYGQDRKKSFEDIKKQLYRINKIILIIVFISSLVSIIMFMFRISFSFKSGDMTFRQGFLENRLFGVYTSPNTGALFSVISLSAMLMNSIIKHGKIKFNGFYIVNLIVQIVYFSLTLSNGGFLTLVAFAILFAVVYFFPKMQLKKGTVSAVLLSIVFAVVMIAGVRGVMYGTRYVMSYVPSVVDKAIDRNASVEADKEKEEQKIQFERIESGDDVSNGRITIWTGSLKLLLQHPLFGYADMWVEEEDTVRFDRSVLDENELVWLYKPNGNLHNAYIHIAAYSGIVGFALVLIFALLLVKKIGFALLRGRKDTQFYSLLAVLFVTLGTIAANGMVEAHILYTRQDPYGAIFWLYTGLAALLAELYTYSKDYAKEGAPNTEKFAFAVDTPLQTLNCVNFVLNDTKGSKGKADLYMYHQFKGSDELSARLKESGVFNNVYDIDVYKKYPSVLNKFVTIFRLFLPANAIRSAARQKIPMSKKSYAYIGVSFPTSFTTGLHMAYPRAQVLLIEDGIGSYFGNIVDDYATGIFKWIDKFFFGNTLSIQPTEIYLSNPQLSKNRIDSKVCRLDMVKPENLSVIEKIFDYKHNQIYKEHKAVYLTQPLDEKDGFVKENEKKIEDLLVRSFSTEVVARIHPRHNAAAFDNMCPDTFRNLWELECVKQIGDEHILIGAFSTAQFMPKLLKNVEPTIICTYPILFNNLDDAFWQGTKKFIDDFKALYSNPQKIYTPESLEALQKLLNDLGDANEM